MRMALRWFGPADPVRLEQIRQIPGVGAVVSALHEEPVGAAWPEAGVAQLVERVGSAGLALTVVESLPVHEDIKLGGGERDRYTDAYCESIRVLGAAGVPVVCYNFMPVFDWVRTELSHRLADGSFALAFDQRSLEAIDLGRGTGALPGWSAAYDAAALQRLLAAYAAVEAEPLWANLAWFLERVVPVAEASNVRLALHPDDPPWPVFGLPRIITDGAALERVCELVPSVANGITLCTGSLAALRSNDVVEIAQRLAARGRIHFVHCRNVRVTGVQQFHEVAHPSAHGEVDMAGVLRVLKAADYRYTIRPDHGRMIWGESGRPGYGLYDRALGATYLQGLWEGLAGEAGQA